jgi:hypothetical protein
MRRVRAEPEPAPPDLARSADPPPGRPSTAVLLTTAAAVTLAVLGPVLVRRGYVLSYDMVVVPDPPLAARVLGTDGGVPRAVPSDLLVVALSWVAPADLVQKAILVAVAGLAVVGAGRLAASVTGCSRTASVVAGLVYAWSPFLAERLVLGQWALLLGFAALPWALAAAVDVAAEVPGAPARLCAWTVPAAVGGGNATVLLATPVLVVLVHAGRRRAGATALYLAFVVAMSLPWVLPAVLRPGGLPSDPAGVDAFAAAPDGPLGTLGSLATLGGIWNAAVVPPERGNVVLAVAALACVVAVVLAAGPAVWRSGPGGRALFVAGLAGLVAPALLATSPGRAALSAVVAQVPGGGLLRDGQKLLAPWVLLVAVLAAVAADRARRAVAPLRLGPVVGAAAAALPVALLPSLALGASGRLAPATYPASWTTVRAALDADPAAGAVVVLPWAPYRRFAWNDSRVVLDPAQRISDRPVVLDDRLPLRSGTVAGEDRRAAAVLALLEAPATARTVAGDTALPRGLAGLGFRYALVHRGQPGSTDVAARLNGTSVAVRTADLDLYRLPDLPAGRAASGEGLRPPGSALQLGGLAVAGGLAVWSLAVVARSSSGRRVRPV